MSGELGGFAFLPALCVLEPMRGQLSYVRLVAGEEMLTIKQAAADLGVPSTRAMDLVRKGRLATAVPRTGGPATWRIARAELDAFPCS